MLAVVDVVDVDVEVTGWVPKLPVEAVLVAVFDDPHPTTVARVNGRTRAIITARVGCTR